MLPDDVLLEVFDFYLDPSWDEDEDEVEVEVEVKGGDMLKKKEIEGWQPLVHVCRRWRSVVFGSPRRLNLRLACTANTLVRDTVDIWPALPLLIRNHAFYPGCVDNIVALLERSDLVRRISQISLWGELEDILEAMQVPFPELTHLDLYDNGQTALPLSDSFLGGSAPRLRSLYLEAIPYPGLPKLLLSATHLTRLDLYDIPDSGYIPPEAMAACLSTLTSLKQLSLEFQFHPPLPDQESQRRPPSIRTSLPVLDYFWFRGGGEYLEVLVARIDAPQLRRLEITFFNDIVFFTPQFTRFISHTPMFEAFNVARLGLRDSHASITLSSTSEDFDESLNVSVYCTELDWQLSFLEQVCSSFLPPLSTLQDLYMSGRPWPQDWKDNIDYAQWLELLHSFSAVKNLYLSKELAPCVVPALQDLVGSRTTEVFPNLQNIFLEGLNLTKPEPVQEGIRKFVAARNVTSHPITVSHW
jgi:hypothetical protein